MEPVGSLAGAWTFAEVLDFCRSLDLIYTIEVGDSQASLKLWLTLKVHFNADNGFEEVQAQYELIVGHRFGECLPFSAEAFVDAAKSVQITPAYPLYQLQFFQAEKRRQDSGESKQMDLLACLLHTLLKRKSVSKAAEQLRRSKPLLKVLEDILLVNHPWHRMLMGRDLAALAPGVARSCGFTLEGNDFVGAGAVEVLRRCTADGQSDEQRLRDLYPEVLPRWAFKDLYAPKFLT